MSTLRDELNYSKEWSPLDIDMKLIIDTLREAEVKREVEDPNIADAFSRKSLAVADHLSTDLTKLRMYFVETKSKAIDLLNDLKCAVIDEKSDAGKERVALCDPKYRQLRDEYQKAEQIVKYLELKYNDLISYHYSFKDAARRLSGIKAATSNGSDSERRDESFGNTQEPF